MMWLLVFTVVTLNGNKDLPVRQYSTQSECVEAIKLFKQHYVLPENQVSVKCVRSK